MEQDRPLMTGYLLFPPHGVSRHIKKSWQKKYCQLFKASHYGIERLEVFDNEEDANTNLSARIITLENCIKITPDPQKLQPNVFVVVTKSSTHYLGAVEDNEMNDWLSAFQSVAFKEIPTSLPHVIEENNEIYCFSGDGTFQVRLVPSKASTRCGLEPGPYILVLTNSSLQLLDMKEQIVLMTWPYLYIRRYGYRESKFTFEAGRMCESGEGEFVLEHNNQQEIYRTLALKMKAMRKLMETGQHEQLFHSSNHLQAALGMEARSRSPIPLIDFSAESHGVGQQKAISYSNLLHAVNNNSPPLPVKPKPLISPTVETNPLVVINAPAHLRPKDQYRLSASHGALDTLGSKSQNVFHAKLVDIDLKETTVQAKPPRKGMFLKSATDSEGSIKRFWKSHNNIACKQPLVPTEPPQTLTVSNYDDVEVRQDAWRTFGVDELAHTERPYTPDTITESTETIAPDYEEVDECSPPPTQPPPPPPPPSSKPYFLLLKPADGGNYDTLQHFPTTGSRAVSSGQYKRIPCAAGSSSATNSPESPEPKSLIDSYVGKVETYHDYDEVNEDQEVRRADDKHQGYGTIRRTAAADSSNLSHRMFNNFEYAIVTKPKHV